MPPEPAAGSRWTHWALLALVAATAAATHLVNPAGFPAYSSEEASLIGRAQLHMEQEKWWSIGSEFRDPFGAPWFLEQTFALTGGASWASARGLVGALAVLDAVLLYLLAARLARSPVAGAAAALALTLSAPGWVELRRVTIPAFGIAFTLLAVTLLASRLKGRVLLAGLAYGLALFVDLFALAALPAVAYLLWRDQRGRPIPLAAFALLAAVPALLWPLRASFDADLSAWGEGMATAFDGPSLEAFVELLAAAPALLLLGLGAAGYLALRHRVLLPVLWGGGALLLVVLLGPKLESEALHLVPPLALALGVLAGRFVPDATARVKRWLEASPDAAPLGASGEGTVAAVVVAAFIAPSLVGAGAFPSFWHDENADLDSATGYLAGVAKTGDVVVAGHTAKVALRAEGLKVYDWYRDDLEEKGVKYLLMDKNARYDLRSWEGLRALHEASTPLARFGDYEVRLVAASGAS